MHVALIYPPLSDPRAPQLALPSLAAHLRARGIGVTLRDANVEALEALASPDRLGDTIERLMRRLDRDRQDEQAWRALQLASALAKDPSAAFRMLRSPASFLDAAQFADARERLHALLFATSLASNGVSASLRPIDYDVAGCDATRLDSLIRLGDSADLFADTHGRIAAELAATAPDLVGITITNRQQFIPGLLLARRLKRAGYVVVLGGALLTKFADTLPGLPAFFTEFADAVILYEGETALVALIDALAGRGALDLVPNLLSLKNGRVVAGPVHVEDVAALETPDFTGLPLDRYLAPEPVLPILTGKGCYFNRCKFCDIPFINHVARKAYRVRPPERIVEDVHRLHERHGARAFVVTDEALSPRLLTRLAESFEARPGPFAFTGYARLEPGFDTETCRRVAGMGFRKLYFGLESASQQMVDHMNKGVRMAEVPAVLSACRAAGLDFHLFGMVGLPEESAALAAETPAFMIAQAAAIDSPGTSIDVHPFGLELRTPYFAERAALGIAVDEAAVTGDFVTGFAPDQWRNARGLSGEEVVRLIRDEFEPALRATFSRWHAGPDPLWPPQEEYAALYALGHEGRAFDWRSSVPEDDMPFSIHRAAAWPLVHDGDDVVLVHQSGLIRVDPRFDMLTRGERVMTLAGHAGGHDDPRTLAVTRDLLDALARLGWLRFRLARAATDSSATLEAAA